MPTTIHDLRRRKPPPPRRPSIGFVVPLAVVVAIVTGLTVAYYTGAIGSRTGKADGLAGLYDRYLDDVRQINDAEEVLQSPADLAAHAAEVGAALEPLASDLDRLTAQANAMTYDRDAWYRVTADKKTAEDEQIGRWEATSQRMRGSVYPSSPLWGPLSHTTRALNVLRDTLKNVAYAHTPEPQLLPSARGSPLALMQSPPAAAPPLPAPRLPPPPPTRSLPFRTPTPLPPPAPVSAEQPPPAVEPVASINPVVLSIRGLIAPADQGRWLCEHLRRQLSTPACEGRLDDLHPGQVLMKVTPTTPTTPSAVADLVDFGRATVDPATGVVQVDADASKVAAIVASLRPPLYAPSWSPTGQEPSTYLPGSGAGPDSASPYTSVSAGPAPAAPFAADQIITVHIRGLTDRGGQQMPLQQHLFGLAKAKLACGHGDLADDGAATIMMAPLADPATVAAAIDFGRVAVDSAARTITVDVDPARVAAIVAAAASQSPVRRPVHRTAPPPVQPATLPLVLMPGATVEVQHGTDWLPATVLSREGRRYRVHFTGDSAPADQWVGKDQMRPPTNG